jgi:hypothetical protein
MKCSMYDWHFSTLLIQYDIWSLPLYPVFMTKLATFRPQKLPGIRDNSIATE